MPSSDSKIPLVVAIGESKATEAQERDWTAIYKRWQKGSLYDGFLSSYTPRDAAGEIQPDKGTAVQAVVADELEETRALLGTIINANLTRDTGNTKAFADVILDGHVMIKDAPATFLITLGLRLQNWITVASAMPVRSDAMKWEPFAERSGVFVTPEQKATQNGQARQHKIAPATDRHQATLLEAWNEQVVVGDWVRRNFTGAVRAEDRRVYVVRARRFLAAVEEAKVRANNVRVDKITDAGSTVTNFLLDGELPAG